ncbi:hypothetical protein AAVH_12469 [Aphelenchoides avenae]|nr:hypothetical protein AAVH_12469 [Aphelenchus avenae]
MVTRREPFVSVDDNGIFRETMACKVYETATTIAKKAGIVLSKECRAFIRSCLPFNPVDRASIRDLLRSDFIRMASIDALKTGLAGV